MADVPAPLTEGRAPADLLPADAPIYAGFWRRWAAWVVDALIVFLWPLVVSLIGGLGADFPLIFAVFCGIPWLYFALCESSPWQATLGKRAMDIKVVNMQGHRIGLGRAAGRFALRMLPLVVLLFLVATDWLPGFSGFIVPALLWLLFFIGQLRIGWAKRKRALHDELAGTCVVLRTVAPGQPLPTQHPPLAWHGRVINIIGSCLALLVLPPMLVFPTRVDYTTRSHVSEAFSALGQIKADVDDNGCHPGSLPSPSPKITATEVSDPGAGRCTITATLGQYSQNAAILNGGKLHLTREATGQWRCSSDLPGKYLPAQCRNPP
jgi:uncharacterized RDD family membrane protein YckC